MDSSEISSAERDATGSPAPHGRGSPSSRGAAIARVILDAMNRILAALALLTMGVATLAACGPSAAPPSAVATTSAASGEPLAACAPDAVRVGEGADALQSALDAARPGVVLQLAPVVYAGHFRAGVAGTAEAPIVLCGAPGTELDGGDPSDGYTLHLDGASHWDVRDLAVRGGQKGVVLDAVSGTVLSGLRVSDVGQEGVHLRSGSSDNTLRGVAVARTGLTDPEFGEGVYVGSAESNWCRYSACAPDRSDRNVFDALVVSDTTAEALDVKEGTTGGVVRGSRLSTGPSPAVDSAVDVKGSSWRFESNTIAGPVDAVSIHVISAPWGAENTVAGNTLEAGPGGVGVAVVGDARDAGNTVSCGNTVSSGGTLSNVSCT